MSLHYNGSLSLFIYNYLHLSKTQISKFEGLDNMPLYLFCLESVSIDLAKDVTKEITINSFPYDFLNGYDSNDMKAERMSETIC